MKVRFYVPDQMPAEIDCETPPVVGQQISVMMNEFGDHRPHFVSAVRYTLARHSDVDELLCFVDLEKGDSENV